MISKAVGYALSLTGWQPNSKFVLAPYYPLKNSKEAKLLTDPFFGFQGFQIFSLNYRSFNTIGRFSTTGPFWRLSSGAAFLEEVVAGGL